MHRLRSRLLKCGRAGATALLALGAAATPGAGPLATTALAAGSAAPVVARSVHNDVSPPLWRMADTHAPPGWAAHHAPRRAPRPGSGRGATGSPGAPTAAPTTTVNVDGVGNGFTGPQGTFSV